LPTSFPFDLRANRVNKIVTFWVNKLLEDSATSFVPCFVQGIATMSASGIDNWNTFSKWTDWSVDKNLEQLEKNTGDSNRRLKVHRVNGYVTDIMHPEDQSFRESGEFCNANA